MKHFFIFVLLLSITAVTVKAGYDPTIGRFLKRDPIEEKGGKNLYAHTQNNPMNKVDSLGLITIQQAVESEYFKYHYQPNIGVVLGDYSSAQMVGATLLKWRSKLSSQERFDIWYRWDEAENKRTQWLTTIPKCPSQIKICPDGQPKDCNNGQWSSLKEASDKYHPGAIWEMRSNNLIFSLASGPQQQ